MLKSFQNSFGLADLPQESISDLSLILTLLNQYYGHSFNYNYLPLQYKYNNHDNLEISGK